MKGNSHESFESHCRTRSASERSFGYTVGGIFAALALIWAYTGHFPFWWPLIPAVPLIALAAIRPSLLGPLNKLWFKLGILLGSIISPIVLGIIYFLWITPIALLMRAGGQEVSRARFRARGEELLDHPRTGESRSRGSPAPSLLRMIDHGYLPDRISGASCPNARSSGCCRSWSC